VGDTTLGAEHNCREREVWGREVWEREVGEREVEEGESGEGKVREREVGEREVGERKVGEREVGEMEVGEMEVGGSLHTSRKSKHKWLRIRPDAYSESLIAGSQPELSLLLFHRPCTGSLQPPS